MSKKKYIIAITSLSLVIVALLGVVAAIWAVTQANVNSKLYVTYTPVNHVMATVNASYTIGGSTNAIGAETTFTYGGSTATGAFNKTDIKLDDTNTYVIFAFSFRNNATASNGSESLYLHVTTPTVPTSTTMNVATKYTTKALGTINNSTFGSLTDAGSSTLANIGSGSTVYMYTMVSIQSGKKGTWGSTSTTAFAFTLNFGYCLFPYLLYGG